MTTPISERYGNIHHWRDLGTTLCPRCRVMTFVEYLTVDRNREVVGCADCVRRTR